MGRFKINIVLPLTYGRDNTKYPTKLITTLRKFPKVKIIRVKKDLGPITKILPTLEKICGATCCHHGSWIALCVVCW